MKTLFKTVTSIFALAVLMGCKEKISVEINTPEEVKIVQENTPDIADQHFIDGMTGKVWHNYLEIKMALTNSDAGQAQQVAGIMAESFTEERGLMKALSEKMSDTEDITVLRGLFAQLTEEVGPLFENAISGGTIYKMFCPMAFDNKGAYWYASVKEITNPYMGEEMPKCGSVDKTITK